MPHGSVAASRYGPDGPYAEMLGDSEAARQADYRKQALAKETDKFRARMDGHRGTRRKIDTICLGPVGLITERMIIAAIRSPGTRIYYY